MLDFKSYLMETMAGAVNINNMSTFLKYLDGNRRDKFTNAVNKLSLAMEKGEIYNVEYNDIKSALSYSMDAGFDKVKQDAIRTLFNKGDTFKHNRALNDFYYFIQYPSNLSTGLKKLNATIKEIGETPELVEMAKVYAELMPIQDAMNFLKTRTIKGRKPNPNAKIPAFVKKAASPADLKMIDGKLREITRTVRDRQIAALTTYFTDIFEKYLNAMTAGDKEAVQQLHRNGLANHIIGRTFDGNFKPKSNYKQIIAAMAAEETDRMLDRYIGKNLNKLSGIVSAKGALEDIKVFNIELNAFSISSEMEFRFADKAKFVVNNKIVWVYNNQGTMFCRFPTTFHDVVLSNGTKMKYPSEEKMNKEFIS